MKLSLMAWTAALLLSGASSLGCRGSAPHVALQEQVAASKDRQEAILQKIVEIENKVDDLGTPAAVAGAPKAPAPAAQKKAAARKPTGPDPSQTYRVSVGDAAMKGGSEPLVTIVEWSDFQCGYCKRATETMDALVDKYGDDIRVVYKHNPIGRHAQAMSASIAAEAARRQGKFWEMHDKLFANSRELNEDNFVAWAGEIGLDTGKFEADLKDPKLKQLIADQVAEIRTLGANGTPAFFVNGRYVRGAQPQAKFETLVEEELKEARALLAKGTSRAEVYAAVMKSAKKGA